MISLPVGGSQVFKFKLILTKAVAASEAAAQGRICGRHASRAPIA
jgi:hypothetical protein